jgi:Dyp-type peroxidase family
VTYPSPVLSPPQPPSWPTSRPAPDPQSQLLRGDRNIQGNVLAGFNKSHQMLLFLSFPDAAVLRTWLGQVTPRLATNAGVAAFNERFSSSRRASGSDPENQFAVWSSLSITKEALAILDPAALQELTDNVGHEAAIRVWLDGAASSELRTAIGDPSTDAWLFGAGHPEIHAVLCVAADRSADLHLELANQRERAAHLGATIVFEQRGETLPGVSAGHEHFGFKDGISQPGVKGFDKPNPAKSEEVDGKPGTDLIAAGTFVLGYPRDNGTAVSVPAWMFDGSFLVTRRLSQDVPGFWEAVLGQFPTVAALAATDDTTKILSPDALAARLVGRWRSGTPTDHEPLSDNRSAQDPNLDNDFDFADDLGGLKTPACAHIRKVYPRSGATSAATPVTEADTTMRRVLRRGIPYGEPFEPTAGRGHGVDASRGLVFQCYQSSLADQFVFLQQAWINQPDFPNPGTGKDPIMGAGGPNSVTSGGTPAELTFAAFVQTEGSIFSFTPSIPVLRALAASTPLGSISAPS